MSSQCTDGQMMCPRPLTVFVEYFSRLHHTPQFQDLFMCLGLLKAQWSQVISCNGGSAGRILACHTRDLSSIPDDSPCKKITRPPTRLELETM
ncbi:uncharacterized protein LOC143681453 isoform X2 [Tamandua tetradactyla]|uniref:uncharacterized protein LOC143681453 isoform X2 n=1 Tax=Tamandua tetradactyla TaxID=48850 RepID=UPI00405430DF